MDDCIVLISLVSGKTGVNWRVDLLDYGLVLFTVYSS